MDWGCAGDEWEVIKDRAGLVEDFDLELLAITPVREDDERNTA